MEANNGARFDNGDDALRFYNGWIQVAPTDPPEGERDPKYKWDPVKQWHAKDGSKLYWYVVGTKGGESLVIEPEETFVHWVNKSYYEPYAKKRGKEAAEKLIDMGDIPIEPIPDLPASTPEAEVLIDEVAPVTKENSVTKRRVLRAELVNNFLSNGDDWAKAGRGKHLEPGVVTYDNDDGTKTTYLLTREAIENMRASAVGKPIIGKAGGYDHMKVNAADASKGKYDGEAIKSYDGGDGWEWIEFLVRDSETKEKCRNGYQFSCAYVPTETDGTPGLWHNVPYDEKILNGEYTHFAVVPNPRYEGANIELLNSKGGGIMNKALKSILAAVVSVKGLKEIVNQMEADEETKKKDLEKLNAEKSAKIKTDYDEAMKNAKTPEEEAAAKKTYEEANAELAKNTEMASPHTDLPPEPLGGGDVTPEPGVPGHDGPTGKKGNAYNGETPEQAQEREKRELEARNLEDTKRQTQEKANALEKNLSAAWDHFTADMLDDEAAAKKVLVNNGKVAPLDKQPEGVKVAWKAAYGEAKGASMAERCNSLAAKAKATVELRNVVKEKAAKEAKADAVRTERFNALRKLADERGGSAGTPFVGHVSLQEKEDLGRARYGSRS